MSAAIAQAFAPETQRAHEVITQAFAPQQRAARESLARAFAPQLREVQEAAARLRTEILADPGITFGSSVALANGSLDLGGAAQRTVTFTADAVVEAAPKSPQQGLADAVGLTTGGWVGGMLWEMVGQRGWFGSAVGGVLGVVWIRRTFRR